MLSCEFSFIFFFYYYIDCVLFPTFADHFIQNPTINMQEKIIILDFGSQTTQLIGRRVRELDTYCEIVPYNKFPKEDTTIKGVILSGSPFSVYDKDAFKVVFERDSRVNILYWVSAMEHSLCRIPMAEK